MCNQRPYHLVSSPSSRDLSLVFAHPLIDVDFMIDSHVMSMLPIFHGKPSEGPYRHVDEISQLCKINQIHNVPKNVIKIKLPLATLRD